MITGLQIGENGRLGNQMFQLASMIGTASIKKCNWYLHETGHELWDIFELKNTKKLDDPTKNKINFRYKEISFYFNPSVFLVEEHTDLYGYFQSPFYFLHVHKLVREEFTFKKNISEKSNGLLSALVKEDEISCSVHVRRTDYLKTPDYHPTCTKDYYLKAMQVVRNSTNKKVKFLLFGDDYTWIESNIFKDDCVVIKGNLPEVDMCLMSLCNAHIIANSSFSWWAAALGSYNSVIAPAVWFGPNGPKNWNTIYFENWMRL